MAAKAPTPSPSSDDANNKSAPAYRLPWPGLALGTAIGFALFAVGYMVCVGTHDSYGLAIFIAVPLASGMSISLTVDRRDLVPGCLISTLLLSLSFLVFMGLEGYICCLMAAPLLLIGMALGAMWGLKIKQRSSQRGSNTQRRTLLLLFACPLFMAAANEIEKPFRTQPRRETFTSEIAFAGTTDDAWKTIERLHAISGARPFLLQIGLPVPQTCVLEAGRVGARRTCHFDQGQIEQSVSVWDAPRRMAFEVTESTLPGRKWLSFVDAEYEIVSRNGTTIVVRRSTIDSRLYPRWYWRPFEEWGVTSEHTYVLSNIQAAAGDL